MWREELSQLDQQREQEGHGKIELGISHALALGPPTDDNLPGNFVLNTVAPLHNGHLGDREKWLLQRGGPNGEVGV